MLSWETKVFDARRMTAGAKRISSNSCSIFWCLWCINTSGHGVSKLWKLCVERYNQVVQSHAAAFPEAKFWFDITVQTRPYHNVMVQISCGNSRTQYPYRQMQLMLVLRSPHPRDIKAYSRLQGVAEWLKPKTNIKDASGSGGRSARSSNALTAAKSTASSRRPSGQENR